MANGKIIAGGALAAMIAIATPIYISHEGTKLEPYFDDVGVLTVCSGETRFVEKRKYTPAECAAMTDRIMRGFGIAVAEANPSIVNYPRQWASHTIFAANVGTDKYYNSSVLKLDLKGEHRLACRAIRLYKYAGGRIFNGLINRREGTKEKIGEYELCLADAITRDLEK